MYDTNQIFHPYGKPNNTFILLHYENIEKGTIEHGKITSRHPTHFFFLSGFTFYFLFSLWYFSLKFGWPSERTIRNGWLHICISTCMLLYLTHTLFFFCFLRVSPPTCQVRLISRCSEVPYRGKQLTCEFTPFTRARDRTSNHLLKGREYLPLTPSHQVNKIHYIIIISFITLFSYVLTQSTLC